MLEGQQPVQGFAKGGLASLGRNGDTRLAHVTPGEEALLKRLGGSGTINPYTGQPEYFKKFFKSIGKIFKAVAPILPVVMAFVPGMQGFAASLGSKLGASAAWASTAGSAALGGLTGALSGGGLKGALRGAALGGLGSLAGNAFSGTPMPWDAAGAGAGVGSGMAGSAGSNFGGALQGAGANTSSFVGPATGSTFDAGAQLSGAVTQPIAGPGFIPSTSIGNSFGSSSSPFMTSLSRGAESLSLGAQGLAKSPMMDTLRSGFDVTRSGLGAISDYKAMGQQDEMAAMEKQYMEQLLAHGTDPEQAQAQAQQQVQQMYGGGGGAFGDMGGMYSNYAGGMSHMYPSY
jgi:hypothetical protein